MSVRRARVNYGLGNAGGRQQAMGRGKIHHPPSVCNKYDPGQSYKIFDIVLLTVYPGQVPKDSKKKRPARGT
jgi:hypothetical protein